LRGESRIRQGQPGPRGEWWAHSLQLPVTYLESEGGVAPLAYPLSPEWMEEVGEACPMMGEGPVYVVGDLPPEEEHYEVAVQPGLAEQPGHEGEEGEKEEKPGLVAGEALGE
jgi:hypothetical protein